jgi:hypothetical protein
MNKNVILTPSFPIAIKPRKNSLKKKQVYNEMGLIIAALNNKTGFFRFYVYNEVTMFYYDIIKYFAS